MHTQCGDFLIDDRAGHHTVEPPNLNVLLAVLVMAARS